jgi:hypothetical protein
VLLLLVGAAFGWHAYCYMKVNSVVKDYVSEKMSVSHNIFTNKIAMKAEMNKNHRPSLEFMRKGIASTIAGAGERDLERKLRENARNNYDIYALLFPYEVRIYID